ncbi:hypothetical protein [Sulfuricurvum sp.]|uniref:hypothetical protein n=1 Tax=Sulfuricurvum sp. TaxID=2025608 RepID=UPI003BB16519
MIILTLLGLITTGAVLYWFINWFNSYTYYTCEGYQFFTFRYSVAIIFAYAMIVIGYGTYKASLLHHGDLLNGQLMIGIGGVILFLIILRNFEKVPRKMAIIGTLTQLILYVPIAVCALIILFAMAAYFSETKPVYRINGRD